MVRHESLDHQSNSAHLFLQYLRDFFDEQGRGEGAEAILITLSKYDVTRGYSFDWRLGSGTSSSPSIKADW
jgi:hypothetical protein